MLWAFLRPFWQKVVKLDQDHLMDVLSRSPVLVQDFVTAVLDLRWVTFTRFLLRKKLHNHTRFVMFPARRCSDAGDTGTPGHRGTLLGTLNFSQMATFGSAGPFAGIEYSESDKSLSSDEADNT